MLVRVAPFLLCLLTWGNQVARAAEGAEAALRRGVRLLAERRDEEARGELQRAYALEPTPETAAQLGFAHAGLGQWIEAETRLQEALAAERDPWIKRNRAMIERRLQTARGHLGTLVVTGTPRGAEVSAAGRPVGSLPLSHPVRLPAGETEVAVTAPGHAAQTHRVAVEAGVVGRLTVNLVALPAPPEARAATAPPAMRKEAAVATASPASPVVRMARLVGYGCLGAGVAAMAGGLVWGRQQGRGSYGGDLLTWMGAGLVAGGAVNLALSFTVMTDKVSGAGVAITVRR